MTVLRPLTSRDGLCPTRASLGPLPTPGHRWVLGSSPLWPLGLSGNLSPHSGRHQRSAPPNTPPGADWVPFVNYWSSDLPLKSGGLAGSQGTPSSSEPRADTRGEGVVEKDILNRLCFVVTSPPPKSGNPSFFWDLVSAWRCLHRATPEIPDHVTHFGYCVDAFGLQFEHPSVYTHKEICGFKFPFVQLKA